MSDSTRPEYAILLLGGAKRVSIVRKIGDAFRGRGFEPRFFSYEMELHVPIAELATVVIGKRWRDAEIYADLRGLVEKEEIRMIIPFVDGAVGVAAEMCTRYPELDLFVPGCTAGEAEAMFDKCVAAELFESHDLPIPRTDRGKEGRTFPLIAKPRHGSASKGICILGDEAEYESLANRDNYLIQEYIAEREEISVDCYVGVRDGEIKVVSPRRRLETLGGEAVRSITIHDPEAEAIVRRTLEGTGLRGAVTIQLLRDSRSPKRLMIMEINPRLGGGVVCSTGAGADIPGCIADEATGQRAKASKAEPGTEMCRYFQEVIFKP
ncbi:MAG: ATP-grasp domain-containing protein [Muribaculaceae bacterium]|nr:ATP-grasp domain-containing protein [Muribaculaceae bacterium]